MIKGIKVAIVKTIALAIIITNDNVMLCDAQSSELIWFMQDYKFKADLRILKLERCNNVVLGVD
jgi:hypothetical protein